MGHFWLRTREEITVVHRFTVERNSLGFFGVVWVCTFWLFVSLGAVASHPPSLVRLYLFIYFRAFNYPCDDSSVCRNEQG